MKKIFCIILAAVAMMTAAVDSYAQKQKREPVKMGTMIRQKDSTKHEGRQLDYRLFIPKGAKSVGMQFSYFDLTSTDSEFMMLVQNLNAYGTWFSVAPYVSYCLKDNQTVGMKIRYSSGQAGVDDADLSLLSDDLSVSISDIRASTHSFTSEIFHRSYIGLDRLGRFGLFNEFALQYSTSKTAFALDESNLDAYTLANKVKLAVRPGLEVFMMNNLSTQVCIGIGGISYTNTKYVKDGATLGTNNVSRARFMLDLMDISMGLALHF